MINIDLQSVAIFSFIYHQQLSAVLKARFHECTFRATVNRVILSRFPTSYLSELQYDADNNLNAQRTKTVETIWFQQNQKPCICQRSKREKQQRR